MQPMFVVTIATNPYTDRGCLEPHLHEQHCEQCDVCANQVSRIVRGDDGALQRHGQQVQQEPQSHKRRDTRHEGHKGRVSYECSARVVRDKSSEDAAHDPRYRGEKKQSFQKGPRIVVAIPPVFGSICH